MSQSIVVEIHRNETSLPIVYKDVTNAYTKGRMYWCAVKSTNIHWKPYSV